MKPFTQLTAIAAPIDLPNVDTDKIFPARFTKLPRDSADYGKYLFHDLRFKEDGSEKAEFVLNQSPFRGAKILVADENFGCGSSRETAVWTMDAFGIRAVIAPSFGEIFRQNCVKNGLLPIVLESEAVAELRGVLASGPIREIMIDLESQKLIGPDGKSRSFPIDAFQKQILIKGIDEIALTLEYLERIRSFEERQKLSKPWMFPK